LLEALLPKALLPPRFALTKKHRDARSFTAKISPKADRDSSTSCSRRCHLPNQPNCQRAKRL